MLKAGFFLLTIILAIILFAMAASVAKRAYNDTAKQKSFTIRIGLILVVWIGYMSAVSLTGIFMNASLPPRILLFLVIPSFILFIIFFRSRSFKNIVDHVPHNWIVNFQSFRIIVELLIYGCFTAGILPKQATFAGYNYDILIGITAPLMAFLFLRGANPPRGIMLLWNAAGFITLAIVVSVIITHAYFPALWGLKESILSQGFGAFPYTLLAGFLMPIAVFMHIFSLIKLARMK